MNGDERNGSDCIGCRDPEHWGERGLVSCEGSGALLLWGAAERTGIVQSGKAGAQRRSYHILQLPERSL